MSKSGNNIPQLRFPEFRGDKEWKEKIIDDISNVTGGGTPSTNNKNFWNGDINWFTPTEIGKTKYVFESKRKITEKGLSSSSAKLLPKGTVLLTSRAGIGDCAILQSESATNQGFQSLIPLSNIDSEFLYYLTLTLKDKFLRKASGSTFLEISPNNVRNTEVLIPIDKDKKEQKKIADCLTSIDNLILSSSKKVEALKEHKKGLMQQLFPKEGETVPKRRFSGFKGDWLEETLDDVVDYENGKAHENDISKKGKFIVVNSKFISTEGDIKKYTNEVFCLANIDDILMVLSDVPNGRAIAKCFFVEKNNLYTVNQRICKLSAKKGYISKFLFYILNRNKYFLSFDDGVKQTNLKKSDVLECPLLLPSTEEEQKTIANFIFSIDNLIDKQTQKVEALREHKKGLMQQLFPNNEVNK
jgi:type I restriction enzyme, S subunit